jgi:hypothetical protein
MSFRALLGIERAFESDGFTCAFSRESRAYRLDDVIPPEKNRQQHQDASRAPQSFINNESIASHFVSVSPREATSSAVVSMARVDR